MIIRQDYLNKIKPYIDVKLVKILAGIRRSGKSTIFEMLKEELANCGIAKNHIITLKYSSNDFAGSFTAKDMFDDIKAQIVDDKRYYLLLDEVQEVDGWEKVVNAFLEDYNTDIYVTGSNSKLMSSEISTYLAGRYITIPVYTLSFKEYKEFKKDAQKSDKELFADYIRFGGFPLVASTNFNENAAYSVVKDIYNSVVLNDIAKKHQISNSDLFDRVVKFVIENVGKTFSANSIVNFLKSENRKISVETIYNYLEWLEKAFVIYRCKRYDLQGKSVLKTQEKFYLADQSIKYALYGFNPTSIAAMLENVVYFELKRRGYDVYIGKNATKEIDFVAINRDEKLYLQVCREMPTNSDRELTNLLDIKDHYPKMIITLDAYATGNVEGIKIVHIVDFLLG